jgi:hypothetical protein
MSKTIELDEMARVQRPGGERLATVISGPRRGAHETWVEVPSPDGERAAWGYSDRRSYHAGDRVTLFLSATVERASIRILRDGLKREVVHESGQVAVRFQPVPDRVYAVGCDWSPTLTWSIPEELRSGGYLVEILDETSAKREVIGHHLFIVRGKIRAPGTMAVVAATSTWNAYNDWGGASHYYGIEGSAPRGRSPYLSEKRPWARGQVWQPSGAPRAINESRPRQPEISRFECVEWAFINGYSRYCSLAGWAAFERPFLQWAESKGYQFDILTQDELHDEGDTLLKPYACTVFVGHDEYWTREMRDAVDTYVEGGGRAARFAGNFFWQIRLDRQSGQQIAFKYDARMLDPVANTGDRSRLTSAWEDPLVNHPGAKTFGVNGLRGQYAAFGGMAQRAPRGFTVFRPDHWCFEKTGLGYSEMFGEEASIFGFELDGLEYTFVDGLPVPTYSDGAPEGTSILAMGWATLAESALPEHESFLALGDGDAQYRKWILGDRTPELGRHSRGSGMVVNFKRGAGEVITIGTCEWVNGLICRDFYTQQITMNILDRFNSKQ